MSSDSCTLFTLIRCIDWHLWPDSSAVSITVLRVRDFRSSVSMFPNVLRWLSTWPTSQVWLYRGCGGLFRKTPLKNLLMRACSPMDCDSPMEMSCDTTLLTTLRVLKDKPSWYRQDRTRDCSYCIPRDPAPVYSKSVPTCGYKLNILIVSLKPILQGW